MKISGFFKLRRLVILLSVLMIVGGIFSYAMAEEPSTSASLIVKMVSGLSSDEVASVISANGGIETSTIPALRLHVIEVPADQFSTIIQNYQADPRVQSVEENKTRKVEGVPSDTEYGSQWALPKIGWDQVFGVLMPWQSAQVAILDTGVQATHEDLLGNIIAGTSIIDGTDGLSDPNGHGTSLAGIVAAMTDNNYGIAGIGYAGVNIMPVTVIGADGTGQDSDIIQGVIWAADNGADVILMGFSNPGFSPYLQDAIDYAWSKNVVLVAATGNDGLRDPTFPAGDRGVIGVSATDSADNLVSFSNYGKDVFLAAPGVSIVTTGLGNAIVSVDGTSASAAIVAGAAAFMRAVDPTLTNGMIVGRLARNADPAGDPVNDPDVQLKFGNGRINMARALADTSLEEVQPAGAEPVGDGGPYVGPYKIAASVSSATITIKDSTCTNNKTDFNYGETVCASSSVVVTGGSSVSFRIQWYPPSSTNPTWDTLYTKDGPGGGSYTTYYIDETNNPATAGTWTVKVCKTSNAGACSSGNTAASATFTVAPCGNGVIDANEQCDLGSNNGKPGYCCSSTCQYVASNIVCRPGSGDSCDPDETCTGLSATCPADVVKPSNFVCRVGSGDVCDPDEMCTGTAGQACPADVVKPSNFVCRVGSGDVCDPDEMCTGTAGQACPADVVTPAGTVCRAAAGECDIAENCDGTATHPCPPDALQQQGYICRESTDSCDPAESCTGNSVDCPIDVFDTCAPIVTNVLANPNPVAAGQPIVITATIDDSGTGNSNIKSADYKIDNGPWTPMNGTFNSPTVSVTATILSLPVDVYNICVRGTDIADNIGSEECTFLAVYDPSAGFVTGGGWINSPAGAYADNPSLTGKANFGFVSKYKKGATRPTGNTEFQFKVANLNFHSETYDWLVVAGARAQYKGVGTINGEGYYSFLLTAIDGHGGGVDKFRIKIWDNDGIVYDNKMGSSDTGDDATELGGGSIVIHK